MDYASFDLCYANCKQQAQNKYYPNAKLIKTPEDLWRATVNDYVCAYYQGDKRGDKENKNDSNFITANVLPMDCDNDHSADPAAWKTPDDVADAFPDVPFWIVFSRNHNKSKHGTEPRPRFHVFFPHKPISDPAAYKDFKRRALAVFPWFDPEAVDAQRFFYGSSTGPESVDYVPGSVSILDFLADITPAEPAAIKRWQIGRVTDPMAAEKKARFIPPREIPEGTRDDTLFKYGCSLRAKGIKATEILQTMKKANQALCKPPLDDDQVNKLFDQCMGYDAGRQRAPAVEAPTPDNPDPAAAAQPTVEPKTDGGSAPLRYYPEDLTDAGNADLFAPMYRSWLAYIPKSGWMAYDGKTWNADESTANLWIQDFSRKMLQEAKKVVEDAEKAATVAITDQERTVAAMQKKDARAYYSHAMRTRGNAQLNAIRAIASHKLARSATDFDTDPYLLNTPAGTVDLRTGEIREHDPKDFCSRITSVSPGTEGADEWAAFLNRVFLGDKEVIDFMQRFFGMAAIGEVSEELLLMVTGSGGNGKSTLFNTIARVFGSYAGTLDVNAILNSKNEREKGPWFATLRGLRFVVAAEMKEGKVLDDSALKVIASKDRISCRELYGKPFDFKPSHTPIMFANHLPRVVSSDGGIWRRLMVLEMGAKMMLHNDYDTDYPEKLYQRCGPAILSWILEGARKFIADKCRLHAPQVIVTRTQEYQDREDALKEFIEDRCLLGEGKDYRVAASVLYDEYKTWCRDCGRQACNIQTFRERMIGAGYQQVRPQNVKTFTGLRLKPGLGSSMGTSAAIANDARDADEAPPEIFQLAQHRFPFPS